MPTFRNISNQDDIIDSRDVIERIEELTDERHALQEAHDEDPSHAAKCALQSWDDDNADELKALHALADEAEGYAEDWKYGATLIRESYFPDYVEELLDDCGELPKDLPHYIVIDWEATARNIRMDYTDVEFDGVTYLVR